MRWISAASSISTKDAAFSRVVQLPAAQGCRMSFRVRRSGSRSILMAANRSQVRCKRTPLHRSFVNKSDKTHRGCGRENRSSCKDHSYKVGNNVLRILTS